MILWHGTDQIFDHFNLKYAGTGENTGLGWGITVTKNWWTAVEHLDRLFNSRDRNGVIMEHLMIYRLEVDEKEICSIDIQKPVRTFSPEIQDALSSLAQASGLQGGPVSLGSEYRLGGCEFPPLKITFTAQPTGALDSEFTVVDLCAAICRVADTTDISNTLRIDPAKMPGVLTTLVLNHIGVDLAISEHYLITRTCKLRKPERVNIAPPIEPGYAACQKNAVKEILQAHFHDSLEPAL